MIVQARRQGCVELEFRATDRRVSFQSHRTRGIVGRRAATYVQRRSNRRTRRRRRDDRRRRPSHSRRRRPSRRRLARRFRFRIRLQFFLRTRFFLEHRPSSSSRPSSSPRRLLALALARPTLHPPSRLPPSDFDASTLHRARVRRLAQRRRRVAIGRRPHRLLNENESMESLTRSPDASIDVRATRSARGSTETRRARRERSFARVRVRRRAMRTKARRDVMDSAGWVEGGHRVTVHFSSFEESTGKGDARDRV